MCVFPPAFCFSLLFFGPQQTGRDGLHGALYTVAAVFLREPLIQPKCLRYHLTRGHRLVAHTTDRQGCCSWLAPWPACKTWDKSFLRTVSCKMRIFQLRLHKSVLKAGRGGPPSPRFTNIKYFLTINAQNPIIQGTDQKKPPVLCTEILFCFGLLALISL